MFLDLWILFPAGFSNTLQNFARKYSVLIDTCAFEYLTRDESAEDITEAPEDGDSISGMFWRELVGIKNAASLMTRFQNSCTL